MAQSKWREGVMAAAGVRLETLELAAAYVALQEGQARRAQD